MVNILISLAIGAVCGWIASMIMGTKGGLLRNIILGIIGGFVGSKLFGLLGVAFFKGIVGTVITGAVGACVVVFVVRLILGK